MWFNLDNSVGMSAKHTPGPWKLEKLISRVEIGGKPHVIWPIVSDHGADENWKGTGIGVVVLLYVDNSYDNRRMCEANARLIAAAPDMLRALTSPVKSPPGLHG